MDEDELIKLEHGIDLLIKKYKQNLDKNDSYRLACCLDAKKAIRRIILNVAINGTFKYITPILDKKKGAGFQIINSNNLEKLFYGKD